MWGRKDRREEPAGADAPEATREDLGREPWEWVTLPALGKRVRVRLLSTPDVARLQMLPDLTGFSEMAARLRTPGQEDSVDLGELAAEQFRYYSYLAHLAITDPEGEDRVCEDCGAIHSPLWTPDQTARLQPQDLTAVMLVALQVQGRFAALGPFSVPAPASGSPEPADTSPSTPLTSS